MKHDELDRPFVPATNAVGPSDTYRRAYPHGVTPHRRGDAFPPDHPAQLKRTEIVYDEPSNTWRLR